MRRRLATRQLPPSPGRRWSFLGSEEVWISHIHRSSNLLATLVMKLPCRQIEWEHKKRFLLRVADPEFTELLRLVFQRYPNFEWATFARFGWRDTGDSIVVTLAHIDNPESGDLDSSVANVSFNEQYTLRIALAAEQHVLAVGVVHSHPQDAEPAPSKIDDEMDAYFSRYFQDFAPGRPYVSLIMSMVSNQLVLSGRIHWGGEWIILERTLSQGHDIATSPISGIERLSQKTLSRVKRFTGAFGEDAYRRLRETTATVIGVGGTGSAVVETLSRAGVGRIIVVDPDWVEWSNLERIRGSTPRHAKRKTPKVVVARDLVRSIDKSIHVMALQGRLPQAEVIDAIVAADVVLGCTDQQHSRLALSDLAYRYLVPAMDCGVLLEGKDGHVSGQVAQFVRLLPADACVLCKGMIDPGRLAQELMEPEERTRRRLAAADARARGEAPDPYWHDEPQINTVGYLTSAVGAMLAGYAIGWLTKRFEPPFERLQMNLVAPLLDVTDQEQEQRADCPCANVRGWADQGVVDALVSAPAHWPKTVIR